MKSFLVVISKDGQLDPELSPKISDYAASALPFRQMPFRSERWNAPSDHMQLFVWDNDLSVDERRPLIHLQGSTATTISGYVSHRSIAKGFDQESILSTVILDSETIPTLGGAYAILLADGQTESVTVWNTVTRLVPVFWAETDTLVLIGTRALLLSFLLAGRPQPEYAPAHLVPFLTSGFFASEQTPFRGVHVMPANSKLTASRFGVVTTVIDSFDQECGSVVPTANDYDELAKYLVDGVSSFTGVDLVCSLTGGKDSRLVVAALHAAGLDVLTHTSGFADHPDVVVAKRIADLLGLKHRHKAPTTVDHSGGRAIRVDLADRSRKTLFGTDGMLSAYENIGAATAFVPSPVWMGGMGGESLRGGYAKGLAKQGELTWEQVEQWLKNRFLGKNRGFIAAALEAYEAFLDEWIAREQAQATRPAIAADKFYLIYRTGRWQAASRSSQCGTLLWNPLTDNLVTKAGLRFHEEVKLNDTLVYQVLARLAPELLDVPFADNRWGFEKAGPLPGDEDGWKQRAPVVTPVGSQGAFNWRTTVTTSLFDAFYDQIFNDQRAAAIFDVVDRELLRQAMETDRGKKLGTIKVGWYWGVYSASVLLSNAWLEPHSPACLVDVPIPPDRTS